MRVASGQAVRLHPRLLLTGTLGVTATPSTVNFALVKGGVATGSSGITIVTSAAIGLAATISLYAYFTTTSALNDGNGATIPSSHVLGQCSTGSPTGFTAFSQTGPFATGSSLQIYSQAFLLVLFGSRSDVLNLQIDLTSLPQQPAGTYTGTLVLQMQGM